MQALRLARPRASLRPYARSITATASGHASATSPASSSSPAAIPLSNVEAQWEQLSTDEQLTVHQQLEEIQKKDWKSLSLDEKKAAGIAAAGVVFAAVRSQAPPPPKSISKEWEEASNERALEQKMNPITGISSEGYSGKGFVTHK
ncbi:cytochrome c oxidase subunit IV family [Fomitopsis serialis]|uniref:cytochrome c oxidase subunit IV family n=1 Tax=Fomitopsis serialis TaxID=139415 RepID=UPI0020076667|nr:cytochrome c oxidase subunit IV family [Neoantrodia serialis]KAH9930669.1 cytochrome c oxidase subunit IV family [Neoantrodia serialis]